VSVQLSAHNIDCLPILPLPLLFTSPLSTNTLPVVTFSKLYSYLAFFHSDNKGIQVDPRVKLKLWLHYTRFLLITNMFILEQNKVWVICTYMGNNFGNKICFSSNILVTPITDISVLSQNIKYNFKDNSY
jgi:hypothetical protein